MKKTLSILLVLALLLLTGCQSSGQSPAKMEAVESPIEELRFGMTVSEAKAALPEGCELEEYSTAFTTILGLRSYPGKIYGYELKVGDLMFDQPYSYRGVESEPILTEMKLQLVGNDYDAAVKTMTGVFGPATKTGKVYDPMTLGRMKQVPADFWTPTGKGIEAYDISVQAMAVALSGRYFPITMKDGITEIRTDNITSLDQVEKFGELHFDGTQMERFQNREDYVYFQLGSFLIADCTDRDVIYIKCYSGLSVYAELAQRCLDAE